MTSVARRSLFRHALPGAALACALSAGSAAASTPLDHPPQRSTFRLDEPGDTTLTLLRAYFDAEVERPGPYGRYVGGPWGKWRTQPWLSLSWGNSGPGLEGESAPSAEAHALGDELAARPSLENSGGGFSFSLGFETRPSLTGFTDDQPPFWTTGPSLTSNGFDTLWAAPVKPVIDWRCRRRPVVFVRFGGESDRFSLVRCNGAVEPGAVDRLSIAARPPEVPDPGELPDEPDPDAWQKGGEWLPRVKLVNPRLLWLLQKVADAFPHRAIYIYSGYRPHRDKAQSQGHHSQHGEGRAMDIQVYGIPNETLFQYCRKLEDVGCGYYPNSKFVHVDVRKPGTGHAFWIDISGPGEPSRYVDSWPGIVEQGALAWVQLPPRNSASPQGPRPRTPDERGSADAIRK
jgi:hypothetical protein